MIENEKKETVVTDIKMPFLSMVIFMIKWVIASIPALIILTILFALITALFSGIVGSLGMMNPRGY